jgi:polyhydroxyalkanoate synthesis regulator phasin
MAETLDLFGVWREALQKWEKETNAAVNSATGDERVSRAMSQSLSVMAQLQAKYAEGMEKALAQANLPSKADFRAVNSRLDGIERQLAKLNDMVRGLAKAEGVTVVPLSAPKPARTRKPPSASKTAAKDQPK